MKPLFVFDLDSTVTRCELLPEIARSAGLEREMAELTERAMRGEIPFAESFAMRVGLLRDVPLRRAQEIAEAAALNEEIARFLRQNAARCLIMTGNLNVWITGLIHRLGMDGRCMCSRGLVKDGRLLGVHATLDKEAAARALPRPFIAIGDGSNDIGMLREADIGIAFGGVRALSEDICRAADRIVNDELELCRFLQRYI